MNTPTKGQNIHIMDDSANKNSGKDFLMSAPGDYDSLIKLMYSFDSNNDEAIQQVIKSSQQITKFIAMVMQRDTLKARQIIKFYNLMPRNINIEALFSIVGNLEPLQISTFELFLVNFRRGAPAVQSQYQQNKINQLKIITRIENELFLKLHKNPKRVLDYVIANGWCQISSEIFKLYVQSRGIYGEVLLSTENVLNAIKSENIAFLNRCLKWKDAMQVSKAILKHKSIVEYLLKSLEDQRNFLFSLYVLKKASQQKLVKNYEFMVRVVETFEKITQIDFLKTIINQSLSPIVTFVVCAKIMKKFSLCEYANQSKLDQIAKNFLELSVEFIKATHDTRTLEQILFGAVFPTDQPLIYTIKNENYQDFFQPILSDMRICQILEKKWSCHYRHSWNIFAASTGYNILQDQTGVKIKKKFQDEENIDVLTNGGSLDQNATIKNQTKTGPQKNFLIEKESSTIELAQVNSEESYPVEQQSQYERNAQPNISIGNSFDQIIESKSDESQIYNASPIGAQEIEKDYQEDQNEILIQKDENNNSLSHFFRNMPYSSQRHYNKNNFFYQMNIFERSIKLRLIIEFLILVILGVFVNIYLGKLSPLIENFRSLNDEHMKFFFYNKINSKIVNDSNNYIPDCLIPTPSVPDPNAETLYTPALVILNNYDQDTWCKDFMIQSTFNGYCLNSDNFYTNYMDSCLQIIRSDASLNIYFDKVLRVMLLSILYVFNPICQIIFLLINKQQISINLNMIIDFLIAGFAFSFTYIRAVYFPVGDKNALNDGTGHDQARMLLRLANVSVIMVIVFFWVKSVFFMSRTKILGVLIKTIFFMIQDLFSFIVIVVVTIYAVSSVMFMLYGNEIEQFQSLWITIRFGFERMLGQFDFENHSIVPVIITMCYMIFAHVVLLNLLVAIMSSTYEKLQEQSNMEYALIVYNDYYSFKFQSQSSVWVAFSGPFSVGSFGLGILVGLTPRQYQQFINKIWITLAYSLTIMIPSYGIFMVLNLTSIPFAWLYYFLVLFREERKKSKRLHSYFNIFLFMIKSIIWVVLGLPYLLLVSIINDSFQYFRCCFQHVNSKEQFPSSPVFDITTIKSISLKRENNSFVGESEFFQEKLYEKIYDYVKLNRNSYQTPAKSMIGNYFSPEKIQNEVQSLKSNFFGLQEGEIKQFFQNIDSFNKSIEYSAEFIKPARAKRRKLSRLFYSYTPSIYIEALKQIEFLKSD